MSERLPPERLSVIEGFLTVQGRGHGTECALEDRLIGSSGPPEALRFVSKLQMGQASFYVWSMLRRGPTSFVTREVSDRSGGLAATDGR